MRDLTEFGTDAYPLHPSGMRKIIECPWRSVMSFLDAGDGDDAGAAADTGSAMHRAADAWHKGNEVAASLGIMQANTHEYPLADLTDAAALFLAYAADERNRECEYVLSEAHTFINIAPSPDDPTGAPIVVEMTIDHVRRKDGRLRVWDIKTSKKDALEVRDKTTFQVAAYCIGASVLLGQQVDPGGIIMPRRYKPDGTGPVFWPFFWKFEDIEHILLPVRQRVAEIRRGLVWHVPNSDCMWCRAKQPDVCYPKLKEYRCAKSTA